VRRAGNRGPTLSLSPRGRLAFIHPPFLHSCMFEELTCTCRGCDRDLTDTEPAVVYRDGGGERRAYACGCGAVTVTVAE
jgi:hypothetical protein